MRRAILLAFLLSGCAATPSPAPYGSDIQPLDANGLPPKYSFCVRHAAMKSAAIYDVYYGCRKEITWYVAEMGGLTLEEKSELVDRLAKPALDYAHQQVIERHGSEAVRRTVQPPNPPPPTFSTTPDERTKKWAECSVHAMIEAHSQGRDPAACIAHTKALCHRLWTGTPEGADRLYSKILASVLAGPASSPPGPVVIDRQPIPRGDMRF